MEVRDARAGRGTLGPGSRRGAGLAPFVAAALALYLLPQDLDSPARWALAITAGTLLAWILRPVPLAATSIPVVFFLGATGAASASGAVAGFGSSATLLPILLTAAGALQLPEEVIGMTVALAGLATFVLPSQAMANLVTYETGLYNARDLLKVGLLLTLVFLAILAGVAAVWWGPLGFLG